jgi:hyperosmotically inducible periplasmic protein
MPRNASLSYLTAIVMAGLLTGVHAAPGEKSVEELKESAGEYFDDAAITAKVKTAFLRDEQVSGLAINVETVKGTVQLSGFAHSEAERARAEQLAKSVSGVQQVLNDIRLR